MLSPSFFTVWKGDTAMIISRLICSTLVTCSLAFTVYSQKAKPWTSWSRKEVEKTLNDSAWAQTQSETDTTSMTYSPTVTPTTAARREDSRISDASKVESGATNAPMTIKYRIRFLSAKPVREAFARMVLLAQQKTDEAFTSQLQSFIDRDFSDYIVVAVTIEGTDRRYLGPAAEAFNGATLETLKKNVYLERKDGKRLELMEYRAPSADGMGAKFIFPRATDGQPFLSGDDTVRFAAEMSEKVKLNTKYKLGDMIYEGKLEY